MASGPTKTPGKTWKDDAVTRVVTWNMKHAVVHAAGRRQRGWAHLATLEPNIALVQEAGPPIEGPTSVVWANGRAPTDGRDWSAGVAAYGLEAQPFTGPVYPSYYRRQTPIEIGRLARPGTLAIADVRLGRGTRLIAISLYGALRYAEQSVAVALADIMPMFDDTHVPKRLILGGDLNIHTHSNDSQERARAKPILELAESLGMCNLLRYARDRGLLEQGERAYTQPCPCDGTDCYHVKTLNSPQSQPGAMANSDYLFATPTLARELRSLKVMNGDDDPSWSISDHCPLVAEFEA